VVSASSVVAELVVVAVAGVPSSAALAVLVVREAAVAMRCRARCGGDAVPWSRRTWWSPSSPYSRWSRRWSS
jgi:hypothetical protein